MRTFSKRGKNVKRSAPKCTEARGTSATSQFARFFLCIRVVLRIGLFVGLVLILGAVEGGCAPSWAGSIGAVVSKNETTGRLFIRAAPRDHSAHRAGLEEGDEIVAIDEHDVKTLSADQIRKLMRGKVGTRVALRVRKKNGEITDIYVEREPFEDPIARSL